jgi:Cysteine rich repeat
MKPSLTIATAALLASAFLCSHAIAQDKGHRLAACKADIDKFCASEPRGQGKIRACLESNKDKLAPECKTALSAS